MNSLISIIIPAFNRAHMLPVALESVINQTAGNWELIIIDDGSTDDTRQLIAKHLSDKKIKYYFQKKAGVSAARNKGVELSRGDYIIFLDSDDKFLPGLISRLNEVDYTSYDLICWQVSKLIDGKSSVWKPQKLEKIYNNIKATFLAGSVCYKKEVFLQAGGFDPKISFGENYELGIRIANLEKLKIKILNQGFLFYSIQTQNRSSDSIHNKLKSNTYLLCKHKEKYKNDSYSHSRLKYQLAYLNEKSGNKREALKLYRQAWSLRPLYLKAFIKSLWLGLNL
ncbi:glycosyltransferase family 2 protein [Salegentibacter sp. JZCK2]|uniref:glycosyltransferase family 2 protein n=1 Tax=Salegentibacter tibetensis TaxID=2873600 RepID=UPI001CCA0A32|nr:glycosyltransferase family A protein [Salegentibacter tibetensis]MBZ9729063.1 glycosyltransferase family 2 protein [Salegentibacter tibetensis]